MINENSAKQYCSEDISLIENYAEAIADQTQTWHCHHRGEILPCGKYSRAQLKKYGLYFSRPANELIFLTPANHKRLHQLGNKYCFGKHHSEESIAKMSAAKKSENNPFFGKHLSEEHCAKISVALKGEKNPLFGKHHSAKTLAKMSAALKGENNPNFGKHWFNNGKISVFRASCPEGFFPGRITKQR